MLRVKICGLTRPEDALSAARLGADAVGVVFSSGSPRFVEPLQAREIFKSLPPWVARVGVFVDAEPVEIARTVARVGLTAVQLHGRETPEYVSRLGLPLPVIKAMAVTAGWEERAAGFQDVPLLLDHAVAGRTGGTGEPWDWQRFNAARRPRYFILAGGLTPTNVAAAVTRLEPDAIDVSSGVESSPGIKDERKLRDLFRAVQPFRNAGRTGE